MAVKRHQSNTPFSELNCGAVRVSCRAARSELAVALHLVITWKHATLEKYMDPVAAGGSCCCSWEVKGFNGMLRQEDQVTQPFWAWALARYKIKCFG